MTWGPGKYDNVCTLVRQITGGSVIVMVIDGKQGNGMSCQSDVFTLMDLPDLLENTAKLIRESGPGGPQ